MAHFEHVRYAVDDGIATLTLHRPERTGALGGPRLGPPSDEDHEDGGGVVTLRVYDLSKPVIAAFLEKRPARFPLRPSVDMPPFVPWWTPREFSRDGPSTRHAGLDKADRGG